MKPETKRLIETVKFFTTSEKHKCWPTTRGWTIKEAKDVLATFARDAEAAEIERAVMTDRYAVRSLDAQLHGVRYAVIDTKDDLFGLHDSIVIIVSDVRRAIRIRDDMNTAAAVS